MEESENKAIIGQIAEALTRIMAAVPKSHENKSSDPNERARQIINASAIKAATTSGTLALPPGVAGLITILPDLIVVWSIQKQMVADIAGAFGKTATLDPVQMLWCLFKHGCGQYFRDIIIRVGERFLIRRASLRTMQGLLSKISIKVTQRLLGKGISRWIPIIGAIGMGVTHPQSLYHFLS